MYIPETFEQSSRRPRQKDVYYASKDASDDTKEKEEKADSFRRTRRTHIHCTVSITLFCLAAFIYTVLHTFSCHRWEKPEVERVYLKCCLLFV